MGGLVVGGSVVGGLVEGRSVVGGLVVGGFVVTLRLGIERLSALHKVKNELVHDNMNVKVFGLKLFFLECHRGSTVHTNSMNDM